jgi:hypothetical protein
MNVESEPGSGDRRYRNGRVFAATTVAAVVGIVVLLASSSTASAAFAPAPSAPITAPYTGTEVGSAIIIYGSTNGPVCGVAGSLPVGPFFNMTNGYDNMSAKATSDSCGTGTSSASVTAQAGFDSLDLTGLGGAHHMKVNWLLDFSVKLSSNAPGTSNSIVYFSVEPGAVIYDLTNGSVFSQDNYPQTTYTFISGTFTHTYKVHQTVFDNSTLKSSHYYEIQVWVIVEVYASVAPGSSTASALVNMGSDAKHGLLTSITGM